MKKNLIIGLLAIASCLMAEECPTNYYDAVYGKKDAELKSAISAVIRPHTAIAYGSGKNKTWGVFYYSDQDENGYCMDMYCDNWEKFGSVGSSISGMNIEHSFAKSWWGGDNNDAYKDCYHLNPANSVANSTRSSYPLGVPTSSIKPDSVSGSLRVGKATYAGKTFWVFEPKDEYKGDFARAYFYMATCYGDELTWVTTNSGLGSYYAMRDADDDNEYLEFQDWEIEVLLAWHRQDPVSTKEIKRMDAVSNFQHNRNPYIDHPEWVEYIWGNKKGQILSSSATVKVTGVEFAKDVITLQEGASAQLAVNIIPANATNQSLTWQSNNEVIAKVVNGVVTGVSEGDATITVTTVDGGYTDQCTVQVTPKTKPVGEGYVLVTDVASLQAGDSLIMGVQKVSNTEITCYAAGSMGNNKYLSSVSASVTNDVMEATDAEIITLGGKAGAWTLTTSEGKIGVIKVKNLLLNNTAASNTWIISIADSLATIANTVDSCGHFLYNVNSPRFTTYSSKASASMLLPRLYKLVKSDVKVTEVSLNEEELFVNEGETAQLTATVLPANAKNKKVTWNTEDASIATVEDGVVTGVAKGTTIVYVQTEDGGFMAECVITVLKPVTGVTISPKTATVAKDKMVMLVASIDPADASNQDVAWLSRDTTVATVINGVVTGLKAGETTIVATSEDGGFMDSCVVTVKETDIFEGYYLLTDANSLKAGDKFILAAKKNTSYYAAGAMNGGKYFSQVDAVVLDDEIEAAQAIIITLGGQKGAWTLTTSEGTIGALGNKGLTRNEGTQTWTIAIADSIATIANTNTDYGRILYNSNNPRFMNYTSAITSSMLLPCIYKYGKRGKPTSVKVSVLSENVAKGLAFGEGTYRYDSTIYVAASAKKGYSFDRWSDGVREEARPVKLTQDTLLTAYFSAEGKKDTVVIHDTTFVNMITVNSMNPTMGSALLQAYAVPEKGYDFSCWSDGNTSNPRVVENTDEPQTFTAVFTNGEPLQVSTISTDENPSKLIQQGQLVIIRNGVRYDAVGRLL